MASKEDYENRNLGRFRRIFPSDDRLRQERYCKIMSSAFSVFLAGRGNSMQKEIQVNYNNKYREEELLDMIAECEADERDSRVYLGGPRPPRGPKPLQSMPESLPPPPEDDIDDDDSDDSSPSSPDHRRFLSRSRPQSQRSRASVGSNSRPNSGMTLNSQVANGGARPQSQTAVAGSSQRSRSLTRPATLNKLTALQRSSVDDNFLNSMVKEREDELTRKTLASLNEMRIKFPGKSDQEAELLLDQLNENWKFHKPRIASYWLVKLDSIKRRKVIDIVRSNVRAMLQRIWRTSDIDNLRLNRIFSRVFNRLLWSHGQGLWNCFSTIGNSWETIFSKSSENVSEAELDCCRRIVQLCRDCLLIVYKFADEAKNPVSATTENTKENALHAQPQNGYLSGRDLKPPLSWNPQPAYSQRYSKLYQSGLGHS